MSSPFDVLGSRAAALTKAVPLTLLLVLFPPKRSPCDKMTFFTHSTQLFEPIHPPCCPLSRCFIVRHVSHMSHCRLASQRAACSVKVQHPMRRRSLNDASQNKCLISNQSQQSSTHRKIHKHIHTYMYVRVPVFA